MILSTLSRMHHSLLLAPVLLVLAVVAGCGGSDGHSPAAESPSSVPSVEPVLARSTAKPVVEMSQSELGCVGKSLEHLRAMGSLNDARIDQAPREDEIGADGQVDATRSIDRRIDIDEDGDDDIAQRGTVVLTGTVIDGKIDVEGFIDLDFEILNGAPVLSSDGFNLVPEQGRYKYIERFQATGSDGFLITTTVLGAFLLDGLSGTWENEAESGTFTVTGGVETDFETVDDPEALVRSVVTVELRSEAETCRVRIESEGSVDLDAISVGELTYWVEVGGTVYGPFSVDELEALVDSFSDG